MKRILLALALTALSLVSQAKSFVVNSPGGNIAVKVELDDEISFSVMSDGKEVFSASSLGMVLREGTLGKKPVLKSKRTMDHNRCLTPVVAYKGAEIVDRCRVLKLGFRGGWELEFRAYDDGVAYRFLIERKGVIDVLDESLRLRFAEGTKIVMQRSGGYETAYEEQYEVVVPGEWTAGDRKALLPFLADAGDGTKVLVSESALRDYPCMFFESLGDGAIGSSFPKVPLEGEQWGDRYIHATSYADYIARTEGSRSFPWRYFVITTDDGQLLTNTMTARLAEEPAVTETDWIRPGQVSWEFWNAAAPYGPDVDFVAGINTETYKYFIDFASKYGVPYIIMDEGWAKRTDDPYTPSDNVDVKELIRYGEERGVGVILWMTWLAVEKHPEMFEVLSGWGVKGLKIDFMNRSDQWMVNYYERVVAEAAKHKMVISFHGSFKPSGLEYKYPNLLTYEGVRGMENMGGCPPSNSVWLPFIRNAAGPMDYTPGAMISMQPEVYCGNRPNAASVGTRAYQLALYVLFESGLQMLSDSPTMYYANPECTRFIASVPVTWDETIALDCRAGHHAVVAKRKGDKWYLGAINGTDSSVDVRIPLDFLSHGREYVMESFSDGPNSFRQAMDFRHREEKVAVGTEISVKMARNGGWAAVIVPR